MSPDSKLNTLTPFMVKRASIGMNEQKILLRRLTQPFFTLSWSLMVSGCVIGPTPSLTNTWEIPSSGIEIVSEHPHTPHLQVLIMYSGLASSHSALRLVGRENDVLLWDPAGDYARFDGRDFFQSNAKNQLPRRMQDLIIRDPPTLETYAEFRWSLDDTRVEVFEWDISPIQAEQLRLILLEGTDELHPSGSFSSFTWPFMCTVAVSDFLQRFTKPIIHISDWYFFPDHLAETLYQQTPDRVRIFTPETVERTFSPPPHHPTNQVRTTGAVP